jgi:DNA-binding transcriptional LysR family regulator
LNFTLDLYKIFYYAAKNLSYTKAAEELFVTQSSVSQAISQLEKQLDTKLFFRIGRNVKLTFEGNVLFGYVSKGYLTFLRGENELSSLKSLEHGTVKIGASDTISKHFLMKHITQFHIKFPKVKISVRNRPSPVSKTMLLNGELDFAIVNYNEGIEDKHLDVTKVATTDNVFIASKDYLNSLQVDKSHVFHLEDIISHPIITLEKNSTTRKLFDRFLSENNISVEPQFDFGSIDLIIDLVNDNMGIGYIPKMALSRRNKSNLIILNCKESLPITDICLLRSKSIPLSTASTKFVELIIE